MLNILVMAMLILAAIIHLLPLSGVLGAARLQQLYGLSLSEPNLLLLMRHRAVLFGLLGAYLLWAAWAPGLRDGAIAAGLISTVAFLGLAGPPAALNNAMRRVLFADVVAVLALLIAALGEWLR